METEHNLHIHPESSQHQFNRCYECAVGICDVLKNCTRECLDMIAVSKKVYQFIPGQRIIMEGNTDKGIFFVESGKVKIYKSDQKGKELIIRFAHPGEVIGYFHEEENIENNVSATAVTETTLCFIDKIIFKELTRLYPELAIELLLFFSKELEQSEDKSLKLATMNVPEKVADAILSMYYSFGTHDKNQTLNLELSRQDIANLAGTTKEQVSKVISEMKSKGILSSKGKQINLHNLEALKAMARV